ncbi:MAG: alpha/beta hydrolase [Clostridia bacterium]|nr:alpha/beta hydrolase [Clostridia bacterium]
MLFLHGYLSCKESFYYQLAAVEKQGKRAVAPDMPSFGKSAQIDKPWSVGDYAVWLKSFMDETDLKGADVVAHSFGARVIFKLLSFDNSYANRLIITGGAGLVKPRSPRYIRQVKRYRRIKKLFPRYAEKHFGSAEYRSLSPLMKESYKLIVNEDLKGCVSKISNPALLIYGDSDTVTPAAEEGQTFNSLLKNGRLEIMRGTHFCFSENPTEFNALMLEFLK